MIDGMDFVEVNEFIDELVNQGLTWKEVGDMCNDKYGKDYSESKWRKPYQIWRKTVDSVIYAESNKIVEQELKRIARAKVRLDVNKQIISAERALLNEDVRNATMVEMFNSELLDVLRAKAHVEPISIPKGTKTPQNYVFVRSDSHYNGQQDLALEFSELYTIIANKQKEYGFNEIVLAELGDTIEGASLRPSQLMALRKGMVKQAMEVAKYYVETLNKITKDLQIKIKFLIVESSNHTQLRLQGTGRSELPLEDLMVMISQLIQEGTKDNPNIEIISAPVIMTNINGMDYIMEHGHDVKSANNYFQTVESYYNKHFQYAYQGHLHNFNSKDVFEIEGKMTNKNITIVPHSCTVASTYEQVNRWSSAPAIHFSIDAVDGKKHQENIVLKHSYKAMLKKQEEEKGTGKIIKLD